ncbi:hypothetical protein [Kosakonia cowanii]|uniref:hypothetical protein n=1 Tax=Kosakonia cowanii TaxID=208223 RepID=UPI0022DF2068|nr:hypothetical protein [Kosakonia cowanii]
MAAFDPLLLGKMYGLFSIGALPLMIIAAIAIKDACSELAAGKDVYLEPSPGRQSTCTVKD